MMKTNRGQRRILVEKAILARHEYFSDDVVALSEDLEEALTLLALAAPYVDQGELKNKITKALKV